MSTNPDWHLLLLDDDEDDYLLAADKFREFQGRKVRMEWASTYVDAAEKLSSNHYDAVLVDYDLGRRTGIEFIREFSNQKPEIPYILYTGRGTYQVDVEAMQAGATLYLTKSEATPLLMERSIRYAIERKQIESQLRTNNRTMRAISNSNQLLMRATDEQTLLNEVAQIIVQDCGYPMVWIGYTEEDAAKSVRPVAYYGFDSIYIDSMNITWADEPRGRGPTGIAIRTGRPSVVHDISSDPAFEPWREEALKRGYASSLALPLLQDGKAFGVINIYSTETNSFSPSEIKLLSELSGDLAYGIGAIRNLEIQKIMADRLRYVASFPEMNPNPICEVDKDGYVYYMNPAAERLFPDLTERNTSHAWFADWQTVLARIAAGEQNIQDREVSVGDRSYQQTILFIESERLFRIYGMDITERVRADQAHRQSEERFRLAIKNIPVVVATLDRNLRYTWIYNPQMGLHEADVIGQPIGLSLSEERKRQVFSQLENLLATGRPAHWEIDVHGAHETKYFETFADPIFNSAKEVIGISYISMDVSERKKCEQLLLESETQRREYARRLERYNQ